MVSEWKGTPAPEGNIKLVAHALLDGMPFAFREHVRRDRNVDGGLILYV